MWKRRDVARRDVGTIYLGRLSPCGTDSVTVTFFVTWNELFHFSSHPVLSYPFLPSVSRLSFCISCTIIQRMSEIRRTFCGSVRLSCCFLVYHPTIFSFFFVLVLPISMVVSWFVYLCTNFTIDPFSSRVPWLLILFFRI